MSKTAYEIESELKGSAVDRTGFGGRPELINFYAEMSDRVLDVSSMPVLDNLTIDALRCGKIIPVCTVHDIDNHMSATIIANVTVLDANVRFSVTMGNTVLVVNYSIQDKTWVVVA